MPGFKPLAALVGEALAQGATAVVLEVHGGKQAKVRRRIDGVWQSPQPLPDDSGPAIAQALVKLAGPLVAGDDGEQRGEFLAVASAARRPCHVAVRRMNAVEQVLLRVGGELPPAESAGLADVIGRFVPGMRRKAAAAAESGFPAVGFAGDAGAGMAGLAGAGAVLAAAAGGRAAEVAVEITRDRAEVYHEVDGVWRPMATLDPKEGVAIVAALKAVAGIDGRDRRRGGFDVLIGGKSWPARAHVQAVPKGERLTVALDYARPKFKTLADLGMPEPLVQRVKDLLALDSGVIVVTTPKHGGLSTLFDGVLNAADRLLRDFVSLEDAAAPRGEIQNVRPVRWDAAAGVTPTAALDAVLRDYPRVIATCNLKDPALARQLVEQAQQGLLVIVGLRGTDAADGIASLVGLGIEQAVLGKTLLGAIAGRLVRKVCPKCREDYLPSAEETARLKIDPQSVPTLHRAAQEGCDVCSATGYLGRTGIFEIAAGRTVNKAVAAGADATVVRQAAVKDGMVPLSNEARRLVGEGITSFDEVQRAFRKA